MIVHVDREHDGEVAEVFYSRFQEAGSSNLPTDLAPKSFKKPALPLNFLLFGLFLCSFQLFCQFFFSKCVAVSLVSSPRRRKTRQGEVLSIRVHLYILYNVGIRWILYLHVEYSKRIIFKSLLFGFMQYIIHTCLLLILNIPQSPWLPNDIHSFSLTHSSTAFTGTYQ